MNDKPLRVLASIGLAVGGALGTTGTFAPSASPRGLAWGIDGVALVMAALYWPFGFSEDDKTSWPPAFSSSRSAKA